MQDIGTYLLVTVDADILYEGTCWTTNVFIPQTAAAAATEAAPV